MCFATFCLHLFGSREIFKEWTGDNFGGNSGHILHAFRKAGAVPVYGHRHKSRDDKEQSCAVFRLTRISDVMPDLVKLFHSAIGNTLNQETDKTALIKSLEEITLTLPEDKEITEIILQSALRVFA